STSEEGRSHHADFKTIETDTGHARPREVLEQPAANRTSAGHANGCTRDRQGRRRARSKAGARGREARVRRSPFERRQTWRRRSGAESEAQLGRAAELAAGCQLSVVSSSGCRSDGGGQI